LQVVLQSIVKYLTVIKKAKEHCRKITLLICFVLLIPISFLFLKKLIFNQNNFSGEVRVEQEELQQEKNLFNLPDNFPDDFPLFPQAELVASDTSKDKLEGMSAVWESDKSVEEITEFYLKNLDIKNWKFEVASSENAFSTIIISKENINGFIGITEGKAKKVVITVALGVE
jgi:hypothetical protein